MFDSHFTDYKITNTPYGKDIVREYVEAFRAEGLKVGFYHSLPDWTHPGYSDPETPDGIHGRPLHAPTPEEYAAIFIRRKRRHRIRIRKQDSASLLVRLTMTPH